MQTGIQSTSSLMNITARPPIVFVKGKKSWLFDKSGKAYLDFIQGWAVNCLGHAPDEIAHAIAEQARSLITPSPAYYNDQSLKLADKIVQTTGLGQVFFTNSGAEANEGAIKLARKFGVRHRKGAWRIITFEGGFHGRTLATMSASGKKAFEPLFEPKVAGFDKAKLNDLEHVKRLIGPETIAIMLEPIQGEAGVIEASDEFLKALRALADECGLLLILDEIQTGIGRTGKLFHYQHLDIRPDILTLGKGLGGGVPLAALVASSSASCFEHGDQGGTFNGNPLMCAVGNVVMDIVSTPPFLDNVVAAGNQLKTGLETISKRWGLGGVRGRGLLLALDLGTGRGSAEIVAMALERGLLLNAPRPDTLRFMPALDVEARDIDRMIECLDQILHDTRVKP